MTVRKCDVCGSIMETKDTYKFMLHDNTPVGLNGIYFFIDNKMIAPIQVECVDFCSVNCMKTYLCNQLDNIAIDLKDKQL